MGYNNLFSGILSLIKGFDFTHATKAYNQNLASHGQYQPRHTHKKNRGTHIKTSRKKGYNR